MELSKQLPENVEGPLSEVQEVEAGVEELIAGTHGEEKGFVGVVKPHDGVVGPVDKLVALGTLEQRRVQVDPVAGNVDCHRHLEEKHPTRIEGAQRRKQAHCGTPEMNNRFFENATRNHSSGMYFAVPVCEHVKHGSKLRRLVEGPGGMSIKGV